VAKKRPEEEFPVLHSLLANNAKTVDRPEQGQDVLEA